ncbi:SPFH domain-containing protein [Mucisphaera sp.]|uniref:SPFH domain-containing protein n=1 Tax=Mucisphaera sp. TaxID=2913024 RepID=UPI003D1264CA
MTEEHPKTPGPEATPYQPEPHPQDRQEEDAAQQSLADALRVSFRLLSFIMVILVAFYAFSGTFQVQEQQKAVRLFFGKIAGEPGQQVYGPGWHLGWPYPIEDKIMIPTAPRTISINEPFWFEVTEANQGRTLDDMAAGAGPLNPERDGALITGDANIVHAQFEIGYRIGDGPNDPIHYVTNVGDTDKADELVRSAVESAIIQAVAEINADDAVRGRINQNRARRIAQDTLAELETGIEITTLAASRTTMPLSVLAAYREVNDAESERANLINQARQEATQILRDTAGPGADGLFDLIQAYEFAQTAGDTDEVDLLQDQLDTALTNQMLPDEFGGLPIVGEVRSIINTAATFRTQEVEAIRSEVRRFESILAEHRTNPTIVENRIREAARRDILSGESNEAFYLAPGQIRIQVNRDPDVQRRIDEQRIQAIDAQANEFQGVR